MDPCRKVSGCEYGYQPRGLSFGGFSTLRCSEFKSINKSVYQLRAEYFLRPVINNTADQVLQADCIKTPERPPMGAKKNIFFSVTFCIYLNCSFPPDRHGMPETSYMSIQRHKQPTSATRSRSFLSSWHITKGFAIMPECASTRPHRLL